MNKNSYEEQTPAASLPPCAGPSRRDAAAPGRQSHPLPDALRDSPAVVLVLCMAVILLLVLYIPVFASFVDVWWNSKVYSYGFFVIFISLYLAWDDRERLARAAVAPSLGAGSAVVAAAGVLYVAGGAGAVDMLRQLSFVVMVAGLTLLLAGREVLRVLSFPVANLLFMIPFLDAVTTKVHWPFQLLAARASAWVLKLMSVPVFRDAQFLELPTTRLEVAVECSGLSYLMSILAVSVPLAHITQRGWKRKAALVAAALLVAVAANVLRVVLIGWWVYFHNHTTVHGPLHIFQGFFVFQVGLVFLFILAWLFSRLPAAGAAGPAPSAAEPVAVDGRRLALSAVTAVALLASVLACSNFRRPQPVGLKEDLSAVPAVLGDWRARGEGGTRRWFNEFEGADTELLRTYRDRAGRETDLYIGYFASMRQGGELAGYLATKMHRGVEETEVDAEGGSVKVNRAVLRAGGGSFLVHFWYHLNGRVVTDLYGVKLLTIYNALVNGRSNGAVVVVSTRLGGDDTTAVEEGQRRFVETVLAVTEGLF
ncbi:MAG TPA: EpsI family protein [Deltaproteobacteria bacterium]|nr:EpsI family protein [Deltaproteobacteria bacterium]